MNVQALEHAMIVALVPVALAEHTTDREAAQACGVSTSTFVRWRRTAAKAARLKAGFQFAEEAER